MNKVWLILPSIFILHFSTCGQQEAITCEGRKVVLSNDGTWFYADSVPLNNVKTNSISKLEIPKIGLNENVISHTGYSLLYNETHEQSKWVAYELTKVETNKIFERTDKFLIDPKVQTGTGNDGDYSGSGYDRGHLAPASDMGWSETTMVESFYYSNISPQTPSFNRGIWKRLEELVRTWAIENNSVYVVTGPVLSKGQPSIGANKISIPNYFYKVILDYHEPSIKAIGFIIPNTGSKKILQNYAVSIDSLEKYTGIDFFPLLPDEQEALIEKTLCINCWSWKSIKTEKEDNKTAITVQCTGTTKAGQRCKNKTLNVSGYCYLHEASQNKSNDQIKASTPKRRLSSVQCSGTTKAGNRCKHITYSANGLCFQHGGN